MAETLSGLPWVFRERMITRQAGRTIALSDPTRDDLTLFTPADVP